MLMRRGSLYIITFIIMMVLVVIMDNTIIAGIITFSVALSGYIVISYIRSKKRLRLIEENCDPQAFIKATEEQISLTGKNPKMNAYLNIDKSAGFILMGKFEKAKEII